MYPSDLTDKQWIRLEPSCCTSHALEPRAFATIGRKPYYPGPSPYYPLDRIFPDLLPQHAQDLLKRADRWPASLRLAILVASGAVKNPFPNYEDLIRL